MSSSGLEAVFARLLGHQVPLGDGDLLLLGVAGQRDHLHAVAQGRGHGVDHVGRGDEEHPREIEGHIEVVVAEGRVLLGIEHLQQGRGGIAAEVHAELVDLVEHEDGVARPRAPEPLDDLARQGADVRPAMAADLGLVAHAAQRDAVELAAHGPGDGAAERCLADSWRAHEAEDRVLAVGPDLLHREVLEDAVLDLARGPRDPRRGWCARRPDRRRARARPSRAWRRASRCRCGPPCTPRRPAASWPAGPARACASLCASSVIPAASIFSRSSSISRVRSSPSPSSFWMALSCSRR